MVKLSILSNLTERFIAIPIKIPAIYFVDIFKLTPKFMRIEKRPSIANSILKKINKSED